MCYCEAPLLRDVATQKHPAQEPGGIPGRNHRGELGRSGFPRCLGLFMLQQVFPQRFHKIFVEPRVWNMRIIHFRDCKGVRACRLLSHFPGQLCTVGRNPGQRGCLACFQWVPWPESGENVQGNRSDPAAVSSFRPCLSLSAQAAGCRPGERTPPPKPAQRHPPPPAPAKDHWRALEAREHGGKPPR